MNTKIEKTDVVNISFSKKKAKKIFVIIVSVLISLLVLHFGYNTVIYFLMEVPYAYTTYSSVDAEGLVENIRQNGFEAEIKNEGVQAVGKSTTSIIVPLRQLGRLYKADIPMDMSVWEVGYGTFDDNGNYSSFREYIKLCESKTLIRIRNAMP